MGILRPLIGKTQAIKSENVVEPSDRLITPANIMTAARPPLGLIASYMLLKGKKPATAVAFAAGITDMEGWPARKIDEIWPDSGLGTSTKGKLGDPIADTIMLGEIAVGVLGGPRVSKLGKAAVLVVLLQESNKAQEALRVNHQYQAITGMSLDVPISLKGKEAMAEKMLAVGLATLTNDIENPVVRLAMSVAAVSIATAGALRGHRAHQENMEIAYGMIEEAESIEPAPLLYLVPHPQT